MAVDLSTESRPYSYKTLAVDLCPVIDGPRLAARMKALGISQSELARRVGLTQQSVHKLITGASRGSAYIHKIARELDTTPAYLTNETDDPTEGAPLTPPAAPARIMLEVVLPAETALAEMFEALLMGLDREAPLDVQARLLAQSLPIGLSQLKELRSGPAIRPRQIRAVSVVDRGAEPTRDPELSSRPHR